MRGGRWDGTGPAARRSAGLVRRPRSVHGMTPTEELTAGKYALLTTYRKDGTAVGTPVWIVVVGGAPAVWTSAGSAKVKRVRRNAAVTLATCDFRGNHAGPPYAGRATVLDAAGTELVRAQIRRKYGLSGRLTLLMSQLRRGKAGTVGMAIALADRPAVDQAAAS